MRIMTFAPIALAVALAACSDEAEPEAVQGPGEQGGKAAGEVLGGSISDAMLPLDQLQSQSPPLRTAPPGDGEAGEAEPEAEAEEAEAPSAPATPLQVAPPVDDAPER